MKTKQSIVESLSGVWQTTTTFKKNYYSNLLQWKWNRKRRIVEWNLTDHSSIQQQLLLKSTSVKVKQSIVESNTPWQHSAKIISQINFEENEAEQSRVVEWSLTDHRNIKQQLLLKWTTMNVKQSRVESWSGV